MGGPVNTIVSADIGGTHARFAIATLEEGRVQLGEPVTLRTKDYASFESAWSAVPRLPAASAPSTSRSVNVGST